LWGCGLDSGYELCSGTALSGVREAFTVFKARKYIMDPIPIAGSFDNTMHQSAWIANDENAFELKKGSK
jgi:hypothetical protein